MVYTQRQREADRARNQSVADKGDLFYMEEEAVAVEQTQEPEELEEHRSLGELAELVGQVESTEQPEELEAVAEVEVEPIVMEEQEVVAK